jgi:hypothetical protein
VRSPIVPSLTPARRRTRNVLVAGYRVLSATSCLTRDPKGVEHGAAWPAGVVTVDKTILGISPDEQPRWD